MIFPKGSQTQLSEHFNTREWDCHCDCKTDTLVEPELIRKLEVIRSWLDKPIKITSGFRCPIQQQKLRDDGRHTAAQTSTHEEGRAADLWCDNMPGYELAEIAERAGFFSIGIAKTWIHVDLRPGVRRWVY